MGEDAQGQEYQLYGWQNIWTIQEETQILTASQMYADNSSSQLYDTSLYVANTNGDNSADRNLPDGSIY
jgi:hypothetical protein